MGGAKARSKSVSPALLAASKTTGGGTLGHDLSADRRRSAGLCRMITTARCTVTVATPAGTRRGIQAGTTESSRLAQFQPVDVLVDEPPEPGTRGALSRGVV